MSTRDSRATDIDPNASPSAIEQQLDQKRNSINRTINELENKFSPQQFMDQGTTMLREHGGDIAQSLGRSFRNNPAPFLVAGVGLAWLMASTSSASSSSSRGYSSHGRQTDFEPRYDDDGLWAATDRVPSQRGSGSRERYSADGHSSADESGFSDKVRDVAGDMIDSLSDARDELSDRASGIAEGLSDTASDLERQARQRAERLRRRSAHELDTIQRRSQRVQHQAGQFASSSVEDATAFLRNQPMVTGAIGIAIGALVGALIPDTRIEREYMGSGAEDVRNKAASLAAEGITRARQEVESATEKAGEAAKDKLDKVDRQVSSTRTDTTPA